MNNIVLANLEYSLAPGSREAQTELHVQQGLHSKPPSTTQVHSNSPENKVNISVIFS